MHNMTNDTHHFLLDSFDPRNKTFHPCKHSRTVPAANLSSTQSSTFAKYSKCMMHVSMMHVAMMHVSMMHVSMMHVFVMHVFVMHLSVMHDSVMHVSLMHVSVIHVSIIHISVMHVSLMHGMHISTMHIYMILDPDTCVYDAHMHDAFILLLIHTCMMHIS